MKIDINLNDVQTIMLDFAINHGMSEEQVNEEWRLSYRKSLQEKFDLRFGRLLEAMQLYKVVTAQGDKITARCALLEALLAADLISDDFAALSADLKQAILMDKTVIPDDYKIPKHYGFSRA